MQSRRMTFRISLFSSNVELAKMRVQHQDKSMSVVHLYDLWRKEKVCSTLLITLFLSHLYNNSAFSNTSYWQKYSWSRTWAKKTDFRHISFQVVSQSELKKFDLFIDISEVVSRILDPFYLYITCRKVLLLNDQSDRFFFKNHSTNNLY